MSQENVALVRAIYDAFAAGDIAGVLGRMSPDIVWNEAENFPYADGNPYRGPEAVLNGVFARIGAEWDGFEVVVEELLGAISSRAEAPGDSGIAASRTPGGDTVVALGRYRGTCKATGRAIDAQLAHVWRVEGGKAAAFQQYADTLQVARRPAPPDPSSGPRPASSS
ncbi:MAG TPA: nuclear transport factor 2 family protein [Allosphingosinicella sp.]|nr:nuclear transport factor 2 family protein [Allosphingosinicella sp.]